MRVRAQIIGLICLLQWSGLVQGQIASGAGGNTQLFLDISTNYNATEVPGLVLEAGIIRYFGKKNSQPPLDIPAQATDWADLEERLRKVGVADLLYYSSRDLFTYPELSATFDAYEHRP